MASRVSKLASAIKENPDDSFSKFALALELLKVDEVQKARRLFENIRHNDPGYTGVYYHLAKLYVEIGENKKALKTYKEGIAIAEEQNDAHSKSELAEALLMLELDLEE
ncbi:MAG: hypothetical protein FH748_05815 [Balneolaceae bacterium]|nr:hypothetical protein [Balneolaceae bacterium]